MNSHHDTPEQITVPIVIGVAQFLKLLTYALLETVRAI